MNKNELKLVFVNPVINNKSYYEYDFLFSETPDVVWGVDWTDNVPNLCGDISPDPSTYDLIKRIKIELPLKVIQENTCYSMEYAINGSVALAYLNLEGLEEYPTHRLCFHFGDSYEEVKKELNKMNINID